MKRSELILLIVSILPVVVLVYLGYKYPFSLFASPEKFRNYIQGFGVFAPIIFVIINAFQVIITPISWPVVGQAGGYIFGFWLGSFLNWSGRVVGSIGAFYIARLFGEKIVKRFISKETHKQLEKLINKGAVFVFLVTALPSAFDDELAWVSGLMGMRAITFILIALIGDISGSVVLAYVGANIAQSNYIPFIVNTVLTIAGIILISKLKLEKINAWFEKKFLKK